MNAVVISPAAATTAVSGENSGEDEICCGCCGDFLSCFHHIGFLQGQQALGDLYTNIQCEWWKRDPVVIPSAVFTTAVSWQALRDLYTHIC